MRELLRYERHFRGDSMGLPDVHYGNDVHYVDGDMGISQWTLTGTPASGERIEVRGCDFYTFRDGKIVMKEFVLEDRRKVRAMSRVGPCS